LAGEPPDQPLPELPDAPTEQFAAVAPVTGARKAAVLMAGLGSERAASVLQRLREEEIESLSVEMARLRQVGAETTDSVFSEVAALSGSSSGTAGGIEFAREVIERALGPERAVELLGKIAGPAEARPFEFLRRVPVERIAALLRSESHQMIALVLANLPTSQSAAVLGKLPESMQGDVALRIARMGETTAAVIEQLEHALRQRLNASTDREYAVAGGTKTLAGILNHADRTLERNVLENLAGTDSELADKVRGMLFVFEDLVKLEERAVQQVLREVDQKDLVLALRGAPEEVKEVVLTNMSERGAAMLKEEMEIQPPQRKSDIDAAQSRIVAVVRRLEEAGTIVIASEEDGEEGEAVV
jgi:flagellar motor switch protein FliG